MKRIDNNGKEGTVFDEGVRERLVLFGLSELIEHGFRDFSLRRVASAAQVSCAAPYRHFKSKNELVLAVIRHVIEDWNLLAGHISEIFSGEPVSAVVELCVAGVRFWIANGSFRSILFGTMGDTDGQRRREIRSFDNPIRRAIDIYAKEKGLGDDECDELVFSVTSIFWGTVMQAAGEERGAELTEKMRTELVKRLG